MSQQAIEQQTMDKPAEKLQKTTRPKVVVPPMRYDLIKLTQYETLMNIARVTRGFHDLPYDFAQWMQYDISSRPYTTFGYIPAPPNDDIVKQIIGFKGYYFKLTTQNHGVDFIWHDTYSNQFHFWGEHSCCIRAMNEIRYRICKLVEGYKQPEPQSQEPEPHPQEPVFLNDTDKDPSVCLEAIIKLDINDEITSVNSKYYQ